MKRKVGSVFLVGFLIVSFLSGCGFTLKADSQKESLKPNNSNGVKEAVAPQETFEEVSFIEVKWNGKPMPRPKNGIYVFTKEKKPGHFGNSERWDDYDLLWVQPSDKAYYGYQVLITNLEIISDNTIRVIVVLRKGESDPDEPAFTQVWAEKGALEGKKFIVETGDGETLTVD